MLLIGFDRKFSFSWFGSCEFLKIVVVAMSVSVLAYETFFSKIRTNSEFFKKFPPGHYLVLASCILINEKIGKNLTSFEIFHK